MARRVAAALKDNRSSLPRPAPAPARPTPTWCPALLSGGKVIVSTGTKTLQDQLFNRDLPTGARCAQGTGEDRAPQGRASYVCHYHLDRAQSDGRF